MADASYFTFMAKLKDYIKNIACLEGDWDPSIRKRASILPLLQMMNRVKKIGYIYRTCSTVEEMSYHLKKLKKYKSYAILVLAFHGMSGTLKLGEVDLTLEDLAGLMGRGFSGRILHIDACSVMKIPMKEIKEFMKKTGIKAFSGYRKDVDWMSSTALELLYFDHIQRYINTKSFIKQFKLDNHKLIKRNNFVFYELGRS